MSDGGEVRGLSGVRRSSFGSFMDNSRARVFSIIGLPGSGLISRRSFLATGKSAPNPAACGPPRARALEEAFRIRSPM